MQRVFSLAKYNLSKRRPSLPSLISSIKMSALSKTMSQISLFGTAMNVY